MGKLVPHLLFRADPGASPAAALLRSAGYMVSKIDDDDLVEQIAGDDHVDALIIELPALAAIAVGRRIEARYGHSLVVLVITQAPDAVRRSLPSAHTIRPSDVEDDLISTIDLALVAHQMQRTG